MMPQQKLMRYFHIMMQFRLLKNMLKKIRKLQWFQLVSINQSFIHSIIHSFNSTIYIYMCVWNISITYIWNYCFRLAIMKLVGYHLHVRSLLSILFMHGIQRCWLESRVHRTFSQRKSNITIKLIVKNI